MSNDCWCRMTADVDYDAGDELQRRKMRERTLDCAPPPNGNDLASSPVSSSTVPLRSAVRRYFIVVLFLISSTKRIRSGLYYPALLLCHRIISLQYLTAINVSRNDVDERAWISKRIREYRPEPSTPDTRRKRETKRGIKETENRRGNRFETTEHTLRHDQG